MLGTASATLVGLLFVAATIGGGVFSGQRRAPPRMFLSSTVIHFSLILIICLVVLAPGESRLPIGAIIAARGLFGVGYYVLTRRDSIRDGLSHRLDWDDRLWYGYLPLVGYAFETAIGVALAFGRTESPVAVAMGILLVIGIHNAWDITIWIISRPRE